MREGACLSPSAVQGTELEAEASIETFARPWSDFVDQLPIRQRLAAAIFEYAGLPAALETERENR
jgi:hypothetical protein